MKLSGWAGYGAESREVALPLLHKSRWIWSALPSSRSHIRRRFLFLEHRRAPTTRPAQSSSVQNTMFRKGAVRGVEERREDTGTSSLADLAFRSKHHLRQYPRGSDEREPAPASVNEFVERTHLIVAVAEIIKIQITAGHDCIPKIVQNKLRRRIKICVENHDQHLMRRNLVGGQRIFKPSFEEFDA